jgi:hypothetical protein
MQWLAAADKGQSRVHKVRLRLGGLEFGRCAHGLAILTLGSSLGLPVASGNPQGSTAVRRCVLPLDAQKAGVPLPFRSSSHLILMLYWDAKEGP